MPSMDFSTYSTYLVLAANNVSRNSNESFVELSAVTFSGRLQILMAHCARCHATQGRVTNGASLIAY